METRTISTTKTYTYVICALFAALTAVGAFIKVPMPYIPFTLQYLFVALSGILLGAKRGLISQMLYVGIGLAGIPVFTKGGGIGYIFQPSFGYLIGFIAAAFIIGKIVEGRNTRFITLFVAGFLALMGVYIIGTIYMYFIVNLYVGSNLPWEKAIWIGALNFLPSDTLVCFIAALTGSKLIPILKKQQLI